MLSHSTSRPYISHILKARLATLTRQTPTPTSPAHHRISHHQTFTMSIAALKTLLYGQPKSSGLLSDCHNSYGTAITKSRSSSTASSSTITSTDLEAQQQQPISSHLAQKHDSKPGFRITARVISDATIGLSDGLTVPFALTAGLSALGNTRVVIYGGLAELIAGAISMGLGGYLGAKSEMYVPPAPPPFRHITNDFTEHPTTKPATKRQPSSPNRRKQQKSPSAPSLPPTDSPPP